MITFFIFKGVKCCKRRLARSGVRGVQNKTYKHTDSDSVKLASLAFGRGAFGARLSGQKYKAGKFVNLNCIKKLLKQYLSISSYKVLTFLRNNYSSIIFHCKV